ncbi:hypothetical protein [Paraburkholderia largidicola]|uniref:Uncharacterized protein n=1 Tax=Paraburkholderia largidicola TaxID=3014751 RepID=A0A7I8BJT6_9BURK|nr:hypothetical protein [Paraburkholderia sp. PGU16]BCF88703.1 hypothetical protein PPGU16_17700 [Paraburkholderia sp. PGU16]
MTFDYHSPSGRPRKPAAPVPDLPSPRASSAAPRFLPREEIEACNTYHEVCALAWKHRRHRGMSQPYLAATCDLIQQHVSDYFRPDERDESGRKRRKLPADKVGVVQEQLGNCAIAQWLARDMALRLVEEYFAMETVR